jgi:ferredoxin
LTSAGDGITFIDETVIRASPERDTKSMYTSSQPGSGTATLDRSSSFDARSTTTLERSIDDESDAILGSILEEASVSADVWQEVKDDASGRVYWWNSKTQESTWEMPAELAGAKKTKSFIELDKGLEKALEKTKETGEELYANSAGDRDSHEVVEKDEYGQPMLDRFVYVDEITCIGCTNCATVARSTFFMQNEFGRARAFRQGGDSDDIIEEAVATCPVDCIWYVSWDDLKILEKERKGQVINPAARLVGGNFIESTQVQTYYNNRGERTGGSQASINQGGGMRCNNCPGKGCRNCPLFGVGENPEFLKKKKQRQARKAARLAAQNNPIAKGLGNLEDAIFEAAGAGDSDESTWTETTEMTE